MKSEVDRNPDQENGISLQQITMRTDDNAHQSHANPNFYMESESESGPPPYTSPVNGGVQTANNGDVFTEGTTPANGEPGRTNGDIQKIDSLLSVDNSSSDIRKRHKSEGGLPSNVQSNTLLDPESLRKNSMYESKSTISGVKFDDSFIGE